MVYVLILLGAGIGGVVRYWLSNLNSTLFTGHVPMGTLLANIIGSGCLAWGVVRLGVVGNVSPFCFEEGFAWAFILVGASGGLSTFSTLVAETFQVDSRGRGRSFLSRFHLWSVHILLCAIAAGVGYALA
jgi:CrcB protein